MQLHAWNSDEKHWLLPTVNLIPQYGKLIKNITSLVLSAELSFWRGLRQSGSIWTTWNISFLNGSIYGHLEILKSLLSSLSNSQRRTLGSVNKNNLSSRSIVVLKTGTARRACNNPNWYSMSLLKYELHTEPWDNLKSIWTRVRNHFTIVFWNYWSSPMGTGLDFSYF